MPKKVNNPNDVVHHETTADVERKLKQEDSVEKKQLATSMMAVSVAAYINEMRAQQIVLNFRIAKLLEFLNKSDSYWQVHDAPEAAVKQQVLTNIGDLRTHLQELIEQSNSLKQQIEVLEQKHTKLKQQFAQKVKTASTAIQATENKLVAELAELTPSDLVDASPEVLELLDQDMLDAVSNEQKARVQRPKPRIMGEPPRFGEDNDMRQARHGRQVENSLHMFLLSTVLSIRAQNPTVTIRVTSSAGDTILFSLSSSKQYQEQCGEMRQNTNHFEQQCDQNKAEVETLRGELNNIDQQTEVMQQTIAKTMNPTGQADNAQAQFTSVDKSQREEVDKSQQEENVAKTWHTPGQSSR